VEDYVIHYRTFIKQSTLHWNSKRSRLAKRLLLAALLENIKKVDKYDILGGFILMVHGSSLSQLQNNEKSAY
jgi:hypothetical protein